jgi:hypothetical protein
VKWLWRIAFVFSLLWAALSALFIQLEAGGWNYFPALQTTGWIVIWHLIVFGPALLLLVGGFAWRRRRQLQQP